jgi:hypothetical protein
MNRLARPIIAATVILLLFGATRYTETTRDASPPDLASRFRFTRASLPEVPGPEQWSYRKYVHPSLRRLQGFVSSVGASVALNDFDGDGLSNDVAYIDTRTDQVLLVPAPGTADRYTPFAIDQSAVLDRHWMAPMSVVPGDFNEDGRMDLAVLYASRTPVFFLRRSGAMNAAAFRPQPLVQPDRVWNTSCATVADYDGDGHLDLILGDYFHDGDSIYNAQGTGVVQMPYSQARAINGGGIRVFRWTAARGGDDPSVTFQEVPDALPPSTAGGWTLALGSFDLDGDLRPDVYIANDFGPDHLLRNVSSAGRIRFSLVEGQRDFTTPISKVLGQDSFKSMGIDFGDMNGDGLPDMYVSNVTSRMADYENQQVFLNTGEPGAFARGVAPFRESAESLGMARTGWAWDARLADFDNDGIPEALQALGFLRGTVNRWPELHELALSNDVVSGDPTWSWPTVLPGDDLSGHEQNPFFVRNGEHYVNVATQIGFGETNPSRGIAIGDVDEDGRLDMAVANMWGPSTFYRNQAPATGAFLGLRIRYPAAGEAGSASVRVAPGHACAACGGRPAVGAAVELVRADGRKLFGQVDGGGGHSGKRAPELLFGLGANRSDVPLTIRWRDADGVHMALLRLKTGWHTVVLPSPVSRSAGK